MYGAFGHCRARKAPMITSFPLRRPSMSPKTSNTPATYLETERRPVTGVKGVRSGWSSNVPVDWMPLYF